MIFLRHPTPDIARGICYGQLDMNITDIGHQQIKQALMDTPSLTRIIASPALRCRKLAEQLARRENLELSFDERLWEMHMGDWEGRAWKDIDRKVSELWLQDTHNNSTPNGECFREVQQRVGVCIDELMTNTEFDHSQTAIICHASPIRATQMAWMGLSFKQAFAISPPYATPITINPPQLVN
jgi:alpha-ribazole phosphatase